MDLFVRLIIGIAQAILFTLEIAMLIRAILSWFPVNDDNLLSRIAFVVTEPIIAPIRKLLDRLGWFRNLPIDMSFLVAVLLLSLVSGLLGSVRI